MCTMKLQSYGKKHNEMLQKSTKYSFRKKNLRKLCWFPHFIRTFATVFGEAAV